MAFDYKQQYRLYRQYYLKGFQRLSASPLTGSALNLFLFLATAIILVFFALKPTFATISNLWQEIKIKEEFSQKLSKKIQDLEQAKMVMAQNPQLISLLDKAIPPNSEFTRLERELQFVTLKNNALLADGKFEKFDLVGKSEENSQAGEKVNPLGFQLKVGSGYLNLKNLLQELVNLDRFIALEETVFSEEASIEGAELQLILKGKAFYLPTNPLNNK